RRLLASTAPAARTAQCRDRARRAGRLCAGARRGGRTGGAVLGPAGQRHAVARDRRPQRHLRRALQRAVSRRGARVRARRPERRGWRGDRVLPGGRAGPAEPDRHRVGGEPGAGRAPGTSGADRTVVAGRTLGHVMPDYSRYRPSVSRRLIPLVLGAALAAFVLAAPASAATPWGLDHLRMSGAAVPDHVRFHDTILRHPGRKARTAAASGSDVVLHAPDGTAVTVTISNQYGQNQQTLQAAQN